MKLQLSVLALPLLFSLQSFGMTCGSILNSNAAAPLQDSLNIEAAGSIFDSVESDYTALKIFLARTDEHIRLLELNKKLREKKGGFARVLEAKNVAYVSRLRTALNEGNLENVISVANSVMLSFERDILELNFKQTKLAELKNRASHQAFAPDYLAADVNPVIARLEGEIRALVDSTHKDFKLYMSFLKTFENQIANGANERVKAFAAEAFAQTGISTPNIDFQIPDYISQSVQGERRPTVSMIMNEYALTPLPDGTPRHLANRSLEIKLELENAELKKQNRWWRRVFNPRAAHIAIDALAQAVRLSGDSAFNRNTAQLLDRVVADLQNVSALETHLIEIDRIDSLSVSEQVSAFERTRSNYMNSGVFRSGSFDFLTSFARDQVHRKLWKHISLTLRLRNVNATHLVDTLINKEKELAQIETDLDVVRAEIQLRGNREEADQELNLRLHELIFYKETAEGELVAINSAIRNEIAKFEAMKTDEVALATIPGMRADIALLNQMKKAEEREAVMGQLSFDYSPGTDARFARQTLVTLLVANMIVVNTPLINVVDSFLTSVFGFDVPTWTELWTGTQSLIHRGQEVIEAVMPAL